MQAPDALGAHPGAHPYRAVLLSDLHCIAALRSIGMLASS